MTTIGVGKDLSLCEFLDSHPALSTRMSRNVYISRHYHKLCINFALDIRVAYRGKIKKPAPRIGFELLSLYKLDPGCDIQKEVFGPQRK